MNPVFKESQRYNQFWFWLLTVVFSIVLIKNPLTVLYNWWRYGADSIPHFPFYSGVLFDTISILLVISFIAFFWFHRLQTAIDSVGVWIRFSLFSKKGRLFYWSDIDEAFIRKYKPMDDYGGWGVKSGRKGKAYNVSGNMGLQLFLKSGEKILIGTNRPSELEVFLKKNIFNKEWMMIEKSKK